MENLFIGLSSWAFTKRSNSVAFVRSIVTDHGSGPNERNALALVASLRRTARRFHTRCRPLACAKHDPVSFAVQDRLRLLGSVFQGAPFSLFTSLYSGQRHQFVEGTHCPPAWISHCEYFWYRHIFVPTFLLLVCIGLFFIRIDRFVICAFSAGLTFLTRVLSHNDKLVDIRYYLPLLILLVAVSVLPVTWAAQNILAGRRILTAVAVFVLFGAACLGYPSRTGYNTREIDRLQAWDALHFDSPPRQSTGFIAQRLFPQRLREQPTIVFCILILFT